MPVTYWKGGWVGERCRKEKNPLPLLGIEPQFLDHPSFSAGTQMPGYVIIMS
jgi:hypothetical protein